jgi:hypothetical protein
VKLNALGTDCYTGLFEIRGDVVDYFFTICGHDERRDGQVSLLQNSNEPEKYNFGGSTPEAKSPTTPSQTPFRFFPKVPLLGSTNSY